MWQPIIEAIKEKTQTDFQLVNTRSIGGGCINQAYQLIGNQTEYFVKLNSAVKADMFTAEALGLEQMYNTKTITIPQPICYGIAEDKSYLVLEYIELGRSNNSRSWTQMGKQLALLHQKGICDRFGWQTSNTIGSTPQPNDWYDNWADFFAEKRIGYQLKLAKRNGGNFNDSQTVIEKVRDYLATHNPKPALVHGDLWSGNASFTADGNPIIFDPACYYGDREVDLAMTELFGGFPASFYQGYNQQYALDDDYQQRKTLYNLYHILNHFNIFGGGYEYQSQNMIKQVMKW